MDFGLIASKGKRALYYVDFGIIFCLSLLLFWLFANKFKNVGYHPPDITSILKATATVGARGLNPCSRALKEVRSKVERLSKVHINRGDEEKAPHKFG